MERVKSEFKVGPLVQVGTIMIAAFLAETHTQIAALAIGKNTKTMYNIVQTDKNMEQQDESQKPREGDVNSKKDRDGLMQYLAYTLNTSGAEAVIRIMQKQEFGEKWKQVVIDEWSTQLGNYTAEKLTSPARCKGVLEMAYLLHTITANQEQKKEFERQSHRILSKALEPLQKGQEGKFCPEEIKYEDVSSENPHILHRQRMNFLQQLAALQLTDADRKLCADACQKYERDHPLPREVIEEEITYSNKFLNLHKEELAESAIGAIQKLQQKHPTIFGKVKNEQGRFTLPLSSGENGEEQDWYLSILNGSLLSLRSRNDPQQTFLVEVDDLKDEPDFLLQLAKQTTKDAEKENSTEQRETLRNYDLPRDRPVVLLRVIDVSESNQTELSVALSSSSFKARALSLRYPNAIVPAPIFLKTQDPSTAIEQVIIQEQKAQKRNDLHVVLDIYSHGQKDRLDFGSKSLIAKDLISIASRRPSCTFTVDTIACYGGGLVEQLQEEENFQRDSVLQQRLAIFTHTKGNSPNIVEAPSYSFRGANLSGGIGFSDVYMHQFIRSLLEGKSYGAAALEADETTKRIWVTDGEAIINGKKLSQVTPIIDDEHILAMLEKEIRDVG